MTVISQRKYRRARLGSVFVIQDETKQPINNREARRKRERSERKKAKSNE